MTQEIMKKEVMKKEVMNIDWTSEIQEGHSNKQWLFTNKNSLLNDAETYTQKNS